MKLDKNELISSVIYEVNNEEILRKYSEQLAEGIDFNIRSLDPVLDIPVIHQWVNMEYTIPYWQMNSSLPDFEKACRQVTDSPFAHTLIGCLNDQPICQMDIYDPSNDTVGKYYPVENGDIGVHLLIGPAKKPIRHFSAHVLLAFMKFLFSSKNVLRIIAEPDVKNRFANQLLEKLYFHIEACIAMPHKTANLYSMSKVFFSERVQTSL